MMSGEQGLGGVPASRSSLGENMVVLLSIARRGSSRHCAALPPPAFSLAIALAYGPLVTTSSKASASDAETPYLQGRPPRLKPALLHARLGGGRAFDVNKPKQRSASSALFCSASAL